jgi:hypothetical protein
MGDVGDFIAFSNANAVPKVVRDNTHMVAMISDICWQISPVTPSYYDLFGATGSLPVNFEFQLVGFYEPGWLREVAQLPKEEYEPVRTSVVVSETAVGPGLGAALNGTTNEVHRSAAVPILRMRRDRGKC